MLDWENHVLPILLEERLLIEIELATTFPCQCAGKDCSMSVIPSEVSDELTGKTLDVWYWGICDKNNTTPTRIEKCWLKQWQLTPQMLIDWLTKYLSLEQPKESNRAGVIQVGTLTLNGEQYALALETLDELALRVNGDAVLVADIFHVSEGGAIEVQTSLIEQHKCRKVVEVETVKLKKSAREKESEKLHADWQKEYKKFRQKDPDKSKYSDRWIAKHIAKLPIAQGRHFDTIRKNMVP